MELLEAVELDDRCWRPLRVGRAVLEVVAAAVELDGRDTLS